MRGCAGVDRCAIGLWAFVFRVLFVVLSVPPHFFKFPYMIFVDGYLRGRYPLRSSCAFKMSTLKARVEVRRAYCSFAYNVVYYDKVTTVLLSHSRTYCMLILVVLLLFIIIVKTNPGG